MCGIAGRIGLGATKTNVQKMSAAIAHRGPDASGVEFDPSNEKYNLAYDRSNEVINSGGKTLEANPADIYTKGAASTTNTLSTS